MMTCHALRQAYLDFFKARNHAVIPSAPLVPDNDPTTLFTSSGMQPIVPFLLGEKHPQGSRLADSQKCFRTVDIDEIGDNRHLTFFEMLGNWSLGDYFKNEQIPWWFEFTTKVIGLDPRRLYVTVFRGDPSIGVGKDDVAVERWKELFSSVGVDPVVVDFPERDGMGNGRIFYYPAEKNWWSRSGEPARMPIGEPGGPDTEMFWDFGQSMGLHEKSSWAQEPCHVNCDCGRFVEIGNSVFMEYIRREGGFEKLAQQNVDYGGGLERIMMAVNDTPDIFRIDLFSPLRAILEERSGLKYGQDPRETKAFRVVMDHLRAATFLISDGVVPSNKDQGYFVRRLIRRAIRFSQGLGIIEHACAQLAEQVIQLYADSYPRLLSERERIIAEVSTEEEKFRKTVATGLKVLTQVMEPLTTGATLPIKETFDLYQSYGFPIEMTQELAQERGITIDRVAFNEELKKHQQLSRSGAEGKFHGGLADHAVDTVRLHTANHMLLESMKRVLGREVNQKGSNITSERLRLDFNYPTKLTPEQIQQIEELTNARLSEDLPVHYEVMPLEQARSEHATGVFDDRYSQDVKVYKMGAPGKYYSVEICGGPHVRHTGQVGKFRITKEEAVSAGVRRLKAVIEGGVEMKEGEQAEEEYPTAS